MDAGHLVLTTEERAWIKENSPLVYVSDRNAPPMRFVDDADKQYKGAIVDYVSSLSLELGVNIEMHPMVWDDALKAVSEGQADLCDMYWSEERAKHYLFSDSIYMMRAVLAVPQSSTPFMDPQTLNGKVVATQKGDYINDYLAATYPKIRIHPVADISEAFNLLESGAVDAVAGDEPVVLYHIQRSQKGSQFRVVDRPLYDRELFLAVPKGSPMLVTILNKGIASLNEKKQMERIQQKWFGISAGIARENNLEALLKFFQAAMLILAVGLPAMAVWNYTLRQEVDNRTHELNTSKNKLQTVFDGMNEYLAVVDHNHMLINVNRAFCEAFSAPRDSVIGMDCRTLMMPFCQDCSLCLIPMGTDSDAVREKEVEWGNSVYAMRTYPLESAGDSISDRLIVIQDITDEKIAKNQMLQANKMVAVGQLAAGVAHEIRNPLGIIRSHSYILRSTHGKEDHIRKSLDFIDSSVERAGRTIDNLLNFSRMTDTGRNVVNLGTFFSDLLELENKNFQSRNIRCTLDCDPELTCQISPDALKHIFINLITNAVDAIGQEGGISIIVTPSRTKLVFQVIDSGSGIPCEQLEKIYNPFFTTKDPGQGTGLGLYIVYSEIKKLNGEIKVSSAVGEGTAFEISIPLHWEDLND